MRVNHSMITRLVSGSGLVLLLLIPVSVQAADANPRTAETVNPGTVNALADAAEKTRHACRAMWAKSGVQTTVGADLLDPCGDDKVDLAKFRQPAGTTLATGWRPSLIKEGERPWINRRLGKSGFSCNDCHYRYGLMNETFAEPYPHYVEMAERRSGISEANAAEMVNLCMVVGLAQRQ